MPHVEPMGHAPAAPVLEPNEARAPDSHEELDAADRTAHSGVQVTDPMLVGESRFFGDYELLAEIARGGMGVIYKARQISLNRIVALKMILAGQLASPADVLRFRTEAEAAAHLEHPRIVPIYEVGEHKGKHYFSMKLVEGGSLAQLMPRYVKDAKATATLLLAVARAMQYAHERGVLHRDLKPANILVDRDGRPAITDFGVAKRVGGEVLDAGPLRAGALKAGLTLAGEIVGTPSYMAPEQAAGKKTLTHAADIYSLGAIFYEMLTGRPPHQAATQLATLRLVLERKPLPPRTWNPRVDRDLEAICLKCLEREPENRYHSAEALVEDLERWLAGEPVAANPPSFPRRLRLWMAKHPAMVLTVGACLVIAGMDISGMFWQRRQAQQVVAAVEDAQRSADQAQARVELAAYLRRMSLAERAWSAFDLRQAETLLAGAAPEFRNWEWRYLERLCHSERKRLPGHAGGTTALCYRSDGRRLASAGADGAVAVWDLGTARELLRIRAHSGPVAAASYTRDGLLLASCGGERNARLHSAVTGAPVQAFDTGALALSCLCFSGDDASLAMAGEGPAAGMGLLVVFDVRTGSENLRLALSAPVAALAYSPDGQRLAAACRDGAIHVFSAATGQEMLHFRHDDRGSAATSLVFSPDGERLASAGQDGLGRVWDSLTGKLLCTLTGHSGPVSKVRFMPDGGALVTAGTDHTLRSWRAADGQPLGLIRAEGAAILDVCPDPAGKELASAGRDGPIKTWAAVMDQEAARIAGHEQAATCLCFSPDGRRVVTGSADRTLKVWDAIERRHLFTFDRHEAVITSAVFHPDGRRVLSASIDGAVKLWDSITGEETVAIPRHAEGASAAVFGKDGLTVLTAGGDGLIRVLDAGSGKERQRLSGHRDAVTALAVGDQGRMLVSASADRTARVWELGGSGDWECRLVLEGHSDLIQGVALGVCPAEGETPRRTIATASWDRTVRLWDAGTGKLLATLHGHADRASGVAFSPDGRRLASAGRDRTTRLWDTAIGQEALVLRGHDRAVHAVMFSPKEGVLLATAGGDGELRLWNASP